MKTFSVILFFVSAALMFTIIWCIVKLVFIEFNKKPFCPDDQKTLYEHRLVGKIMEYVPVGCEQ